MLLPTLFQYLQVNIAIIMLAIIRISIVVYVLPIIGEKLLSNIIIKNSVILAIVIGLWPKLHLVTDMHHSIFLMLAGEVVIGLILAAVTALPFWAANAMGEFIDNQRGATISDSIDPVSRSQSSLLSGFFNFSAGVIFLQLGGMRLLLDTVIESYQLFPPGGDPGAISWQSVGELITSLVKTGLILASPVLMAMMITELMLGIFSRYCPQLNPFSLAMVVKSFIAFSVLFLYGSTALQHLFLNGAYTHWLHVFATPVRES